MIRKLIIFTTIFGSIVTNPFKFPEGDSGKSSDDISGRALSNGHYNRLPFSRITVDPNREDEYDDTDVQPDNVSTVESNRPTAASVQDVDDNQQDVQPISSGVSNDGLYGNGGHYPQIAYYPYRKRPRRRRRPCIPVKVGHFRNEDQPEKDSERFFYDYTVINNHYEINNPGQQHYPQQPQYPQYPQHPVRPQQPIYNAYGGYTCIPNYGHGGHFGGGHLGGGGGHHGGHGGHGGQGGGGGFNRPQGGPLGFFGPGGLFDFSNSGDSGGGGGSQQGVASDTVSDDDIKPVVEINVPDTIQNVAQIFRPGDYVGGIASAVTGFLQQFTERPNKVIRQVNREINSYLRPLYHLFK